MKNGNYLKEEIISGKDKFHIGPFLLNAQPLLLFFAFSILTNVPSPRHIGCQFKLNSVSKLLNHTKY